MKFVLDFDRVLFDTDAFSEALVRVGLDGIDRGPELLIQIEEAGIDWKHYLAPGAHNFLEEFGRDCIIVSSYISSYRGDNSADTSALADFQREKIFRCGIGSLVASVEVVGESKLETLTELTRFKSEPMIYIDDSPRQIKDALKAEFDHVVWLATAKELSTNPEAAPSFVTENISGIERVTSFKAFVELVRSWQKQTDK